MSDIKVLEVPKWGLSMQEATVNEWLVSEGDAFVEGQSVCELESSKIMNELEAPFSSTLRRIIAIVGDTVDVQGPLAVCCDEAISDDEIDAFIASIQPASSGASVEESTNETEEQPASSATPAAKPAKEKVVQGAANKVPAEFAGYTEGDYVVTSRAQRLAKEHDINLQRVIGTGRANRISVEDVISTINQNGGYLSEPRASLQGDVVATPAAKVLANELGINLANVSAKSGKVSKEDIEAYQSSLLSGNNGQETIEEIYLSGMRKTIGKRLSDSKFSAPHYRVSIDCNLDALLEARKWINTEYDDIKLSVNDFILKACALALKAVPDVNVQFDGETISRFDAVHISVAVAMPDGLITPIVKDAHLKSLREISSDVRHLATKAKAGTLTPEEFQGGTFTVSNLGMFGINQFDAIINPPQAAILAVGASRKEPAVVNDEIKIANVVTFNLSSDHRIIDGALAAQFLKTLKSYIENPVALSV